MKLKVREDGGIKRFRRINANAPKWMPQIIKKQLNALKPYGIAAMRRVLSVTRYRGTLERSVRGFVQGAPPELFIEPTAMRGNSDAGLIRELGTRPIPRAPWLPIKRWAKARGLPAFPVWFKIRKRGIGKHPFLEPTLFEMRDDIAAAAGWIAMAAAQKIAEGASTGREE